MITGAIDPVQCDFCQSNITTTYICRHPVGTRKISGEDGWICGLASCISCLEKDKSENRVRCKKHAKVANSNGDAPTIDAVTSW